jgi:hypothetical protein
VFFATAFAFFFRAAVPAALGGLEELRVELRRAVGPAAATLAAPDLFPDAVDCAVVVAFFMAVASALAAFFAGAFFAGTFFAGTSSGVAFAAVAFAAALFVVEVFVAEVFFAVTFTVLVFLRGPSAAEARPVSATSPRERTSRAAPTACPTGDQRLEAIGLSLLSVARATFDVAQTTCRGQ